MKLAIVTHLNKIIPIILDQISFDLNDNKAKITGIVSYKLMKIKKAVEEEFTFFEKSRNEMVMKYGEEIEGNKDENRKKYRVNKENMMDYQKELNNLINTEVTLNVPTINLSDINLDVINLHPTDLFIMLNSEIFIDNIDSEEMVKEEVKP